MIIQSAVWAPMFCLILLIQLLPNPKPMDLLFQNSECLLSLVSPRVLFSYLGGCFTKVLQKKMLLPLCVSCEKSKPCDIYLSIMQISVYMEVGVVNLRCLRQQIKAVCNPKCSIQFRKLGTDSFSISISQL